MRILNFGFFLSLLLVTACTGEASSDQPTSGTKAPAPAQNEPMEFATPVAAKTNVEGSTKLAKGTNPCDFLSAAMVKKYFDTKEAKVTIKESSIGDEFSKNCMAIWSTGENVSDRLVDGYKHVAPALSTKFKYQLGSEQAEGWAHDKIANLVKGGTAKVAEHEATYHYAAVDKLGDGACWSREKSHLVWRRGNDLFEVYVNIPATEATRKAYAVALALDLNSKL